MPKALFGGHQEVNISCFAELESMLNALIISEEVLWGARARAESQDLLSKVLIQYFTLGTLCYEARQLF